MSLGSEAYLEALENLNPSFDPVIGLTKPIEISQVSKLSVILISQNNSIIEILLRLGSRIEELEHRLSKVEKIASHFDPTPLRDSVTELTNRVQQLKIGPSVPLIKSSNKSILVWKQPERINNPRNPSKGKNVEQ